MCQALHMPRWRPHGWSLASTPEIVTWYHRCRSKHAPSDSFSLHLSSRTSDRLIFYP